jgi:hypothetical protein
MQFAALVSVPIFRRLPRIQVICYLPKHSYFFHLIALRNEWSYTNIFRIRLDGLHKEKSTFYVLCREFIQDSFYDEFHAWLK